MCVCVCVCVCVCSNIDLDVERMGSRVILQTKQFTGHFYVRFLTYISIQKRKKFYNSHNLVIIMPSYMCDFLSFVEHQTKTKTTLISVK